MEFDPCPDDQTCCRLYPNCFQDIDHIYGPARSYTSSLEKEFRNDPRNKVTRCRDKHNERHATQEFPLKPTRDEMLQFLGGLGIQ